MTLEKYLSDPSGVNLLALGEDRNRLILESLVEGMEGGGERLARAADAVAMFIRVTGDYHTHLASEDGRVKGVIEAAVGVCIYIHAILR